MNQRAPDGAGDGVNPHPVFLLVVPGVIVAVLLLIKVRSAVEGSQ